MENSDKITNVLFAIMLVLIFMLTVYHITKSDDIDKQMRLNDVEIISSENDCCEICLLKNNDGTTDVYYTNFTTEEVSGAPEQDEFTNVPEAELDSAINYFQEFCYKYHNKEVSN